jgi:hypothetical protein
VKSAGWKWRWDYGRAREVMKLRREKGRLKEAWVLFAVVCLSVLYLGVDYIPFWTEGNLEHAFLSGLSYSG